MSVAVVAEKPAVARDIAKVLGAHKRGKGFLQGGGYTVTWALGHLVTLALPHEIQPEWRGWRRELLPMLPDSWPLVISEKTREQFEIVSALINDRAVDRVVCATDAGREGELIFRYIYEAAGCRKPVSRLWISSLTPDAIRKGFRQLRDGSEYTPLADAARGRSRADWLVGMNLSRAYTLAHSDRLGTEPNAVLSVGRVQTPTLAMVVERELAIRAFVPEDYLEVIATFAPQHEPHPQAEPPDSTPSPASYEGTWFRSEGPATSKPDAKARRLPADGEQARWIVERARTGQAAVESIRSETKRLPPPLLYDLTELQRHANRLYGFSAKKTLELAQQLYEESKLLSYPRTDSRHLSQDVAATLADVVAVIQSGYREMLAEGTGERPLGRRFVDDAKVTDHHAIIPTTTAPEGIELSADQRKIYDLVCRRLLAAWHDDHVWAATTVITAVSSSSSTDEGEPIVDRFYSMGTTVQETGWKLLDPLPDRKRRGEPADRTGGKEARPAGGGRKGKDRRDEEPPRLPPSLAEGQRQAIVDVHAVQKQTRAPPRFTEATLLTAMETAGRTLDDKELSDAMKEQGLGTPATRAEIIENLLRREYVARRGKTLEASDKGIRLIQVVQPHVKSPAMTGQWEARLRQLQRGEADLAAFMAEIEAYVRDAVEKAFVNDRTTRCVEAVAADTKDEARSEPAAARRASPLPDRPPSEAPRPSAPVLVRHAPVAAEGLGELLRSAFGLAAFRPHQERVCKAVTRGQDVLLVMPTGAGKSLCYQLPGIARAGTTVVISPLIALMEDQVAKLQALGFRAERIHSGRDRLAARQVCVEYLEGRLEFLFIAPERLSVPGFPEMLAKRKPTLIAVDEAHCISQWGHDFRPDYRMLSRRLPLLRPASIIALTATATPMVQDDILQQLGMHQAQRHIHGFRRTNIAVEVAGLKPAQRSAAVARVLRDATRRPAIVYARTRKEADALGTELQAHFAAAAYHAGMNTGARERIQTAFMAGELEVIVATIAFGMGVDKPDIRTVIHTGLPGSLEGYYQEIGRAGRDGKPARALLLYSYADRRTHEFFHQRDYPATSVLEQVFAGLDGNPQPKDSLRTRIEMDAETLETALEKLWIHGGVRIDPEENVVRGEQGWQMPYQAQSDHKLAQLAQMTRFAEAHGCRMLHLVRHFGDQEDSGEPCGSCDVCAPRACLVRRFRPPVEREKDLMRATLQALRRREGQSTGQVHRAVCGDGPPDRRTFERLLSGLTRAGLLRVEEDAFEKNGRTIHFQRAYLTAEGRRAGLGALAGVLLGAEPEVEKVPDSGTKRRASGDSSRRARTATVPAISTQQPSSELVAALKSWRLAEARRHKVPAFTILSDRTLMAVAAAQPAKESSLLAVHGIGPKLAEKHGAEILAIVAEARLRDQAQ